MNTNLNLLRVVSYPENNGATLVFENPLNASLRDVIRQLILEIIAFDAFNAEGKYISGSIFGRDVNIELSGFHVATNRKFELSFYNTIKRNFKLDYLLSRIVAKLVKQNPQVPLGSDVKYNFTKIQIQIR